MRMRALLKVAVACSVLTTVSSFALDKTLASQAGAKVLFEKDNVLVHFKRGSIGSFSSDEINLITAETSDFGAPLTLGAILTPPLSEERSSALADAQFALEGSVQCKLVQKFDKIPVTLNDMSSAIVSAVFTKTMAPPKGGAGIVAQDCTLVTANR